MNSFAAVEHRDAGGGSARTTDSHQNAANDIAATYPIGYCRRKPDRGGNCPPPRGIASAGATTPPLEGLPRYRLGSPRQHAAAAECSSDER